MMVPSQRRRTRRHNPNAPSPWPFVGMIGIAADFFLYAASGLVAPWWAATLLMLVWIVLLVLGTRWWTPHPRRLVWLAVGGLAFWFLALVAGGRWLGWG